MKKLAVCMFSFFSIVSLCSAVEVEENQVNERIMFNFKFQNREDLCQALNSLQQAIPAVYQKEVGDNEAKRLLL